MIVLEEIRCPKCSKKLLNLKGQAEIKCSKCKALIEVDTEARKLIIKSERQKNAN